MKVDTSRLKKGTSEVPPECQNLIDKLKACDRTELIEELSKIETWTFGKCELFHWIDILDIFDEILEEATHYEENQIYIMCDSPQFEKVSGAVTQCGRELIFLCYFRVASSSSSSSTLRRYSSNTAFRDIYTIQSSTSRSSCSQPTSRSSSASSTCCTCSRSAAISYQG